MATPAAVGLKIWGCTIFFGGIIAGVIGFINHNFSGMLMGLMMLAGGFIVTSPLLFVIIQLVKLSMRLPYGIAAKKVWLWFSLALLIVLFFLCISWISGNAILLRDLYILTGITLLALSLAMLCVPQSLRDIYKQ